jgi:hypothetical protein
MNSEIPDPGTTAFKTCRVGIIPVNLFLKDIGQRLGINAIDEN